VDASITFNIWGGKLVLIVSSSAFDPIATSSLVPWDRRRKDGDELSERRARGSG